MAIDNVPNEGKFKTNCANNGFLPLGRSPSPTDPPNVSRLMHGDPGGSADLARQASPIDPPNATKFRDGDRGSSNANAPAAVEPGRAAVPVNPSNPFAGSASLLGQPPSKTLQSR